MTIMVRVGPVQVVDLVSQKLVKMPNPETLDSETPNPNHSNPRTPNSTSTDAKVINRAPDRRKAGGWKVLQQCDHHPQDRKQLPKASTGSHTTGW